MSKKKNPYNLNEKQLLFANYYVSQEFFGNGFQSYCAAYGKAPVTNKEINSAKSAASRLLTNVNVCKQITDLLDEAGLNDNFVDKQLLFVATQNENLPAKMQAIKEYNNLKGRIISKTAQVDKDGNDKEVIHKIVITKEDLESDEIA